MTDITLIPVQEHEKDEFIRALQQSSDWRWQTIWTTEKKLSAEKKSKNP